MFIYSDSSSCEGMRDTIHEKEIFDIAYNFLMDDVYPFAEALGYNEEQLRAFKLNFEEKHLEVGTCSYLMKIFKKNNYSTQATIELLNSIQNGKFGRIAKKVLSGKHYFF